MSTWLDRLKDVIGSRGYENSQRRSLQSVILYEAKRCVLPRLPGLRPFQRKLAYIDQAHALVESLDFLYPHQKAEILWRTATSKEQLKPDIAWKRVKLIEKEMERLTQEIKPFLASGRSHDESVDMMVRKMFEKSNPDANTSKVVPNHWEHAHNHVIMSYRLYFRGNALDPTFPAAVPPKAIVVPSERPRDPSAQSYPPLHLQVNGGQKSPGTGVASHPGADTAVGGSDEPQLDVAAILGEKNPNDERRRLLKEVRDHLDLLKEFEGTISEEELAKRKRDLFNALPPAPPPCPSPSADPPEPSSPAAKKVKTV